MVASFLFTSESHVVRNVRKPYPIQVAMVQYFVHELRGSTTYFIAIITSVKAYDPLGGRCCVYLHRRSEPSGDPVQRTGLFETLVQMTVDRRRPPQSFLAAACGSMLQHLWMRSNRSENGICCSVVWGVASVRATVMVICL